jgi:hypothetical protein
VRTALLTAWFVLATFASVLFLADAAEAHHTRRENDGRVPVHLVCESDEPWGGRTL